MLEIQLKKSGTTLLSGDLYHLRENREYRRIPIFNYSRADRLASIDRIEKIITNTKARLVIQHGPADFEACRSSRRTSTQRRGATRKLLLVRQGQD